MIQFMIAALTLPALWLIGRPEKYRWRRWGFIVGLSGQPFWLWATWVSGDYGMFAVAVATTYIYADGVWTYWVAPLRNREGRLIHEPSNS